ncbi:MAG: P1 family peptidase [Clostridiales bacterium]|nr:P1 family peptidase [Clostridiales bacterium]
MGLDASFGIRIGRLAAGPRNLITDVPGVAVGHHTLADGPVQTGVTAILPHPGNCFEEKLPAAVQVFNGFGKSLGLVQVEELGQLETPIVLTNTLSSGTAWTALCRYMLARNPAIGRETGTVNPVVFECNDGHLNDIRGLHVQEADVLAALDAAAEHFAEGAVGAGRGMRCHGLKGGIGSSSRVMEIGESRYTLGALVQTNHGSLADLTVAGKHIGPQAEALLKGGWTADYTPQEDRGSVIVVLATDLPLGAGQLKRVARRAIAGLSRTGSNIGHGSGEIALCFTTAQRIKHFDDKPTRQMTELNEDHINLAFRAAAEATEEAVLSALLHAEAVTGRDGHRAEALRDVLAELERESTR